MGAHYRVNTALQIQTQTRSCRKRGGGRKWCNTYEARERDAGELADELHGGAVVDVAVARHELLTLLRLVVD